MNEFIQMIPSWNISVMSNVDHRIKQNYLKELMIILRINGKVYNKSTNNWTLICGIIHRWDQVLPKKKNNTFYLYICQWFQVLNSD